MKAVRYAGVVLVTYAVVASAQSLTDCDLAAQRAIQAAHEQYEQELRACNKQPACLQGSFDRWIVAGKNTEKVRSQCRAGAQTPKMDPSAMPPAPGTAQTPQMDTGAGETPQAPPSAGTQPLQGRATQGQRGTQGYYPAPKRIPPGGTNANGLSGGVGSNQSGVKYGQHDLPTPVGRIDLLELTIPNSYPPTPEGHPIQISVQKVEDPNGKRPPRYWTYVRGYVVRSADGMNDSFLLISMSHDGTKWIPAKAGLYIHLE